MKGALIKHNSLMIFYDSICGNNFCTVIVMINYFFLLLLSLFSCWVNAVEVTDLYQARIAVVSQSAHDREAAIKKAMQAVLLKVGGEASLLDNDVIKTAMTDYNQYLTQFSYQHRDKQILLLAVFNEHKINQLFQEADLPIWGNLRPKILIWIIDENQLSRHFVLSNDNPTIATVVDDVAEQKGLPMSLPVLTPEVEASLVNSDFWGRFAEPVRAASKPFAADAIAIVRLSNSSLLPTELVANATTVKNCALLCDHQQFAVDWSLITQQQQFGQRSFGADQYSLLTQALTQISDAIYQQYAQESNKEHVMLLDVTNVDNIVQSVSITRFLKGLSSVRKVMLIAAHGQVRRFQLSLLGTEQALLASLKLSHQLKQHIDPLADPNMQKIPEFNWHGKP